MDAQAIAQADPGTAPMMREVSKQVDQAMLKMIQMRQSAQQQTPQI